MSRRITDIIRQHEARIDARREAERQARHATEHVEQIPSLSPRDERELSEDILKLLGSGRGGRKAITVVKRGTKISGTKISEAWDGLKAQGLKDFEVVAPLPSEESSDADVYADSYLVRRPIQDDQTPAPLPKRPPTIKRTGDWGLLLAVDYHGEDFPVAARRMGYRTKSQVEKAEKRLQRARKALLDHVAKSS